MHPLLVKHGFQDLGGGIADKTVSGCRILVADVPGGDRVVTVKADPEDERPVVRMTAADDFGFDVALVAAPRIAEYIATRAAAERIGRLGGSP